MLSTKLPEDTRTTRLPATTLVILLIYKFQMSGVTQRYTGLQQRLISLESNHTLRVQTRRERHQDT